MPGALVLAAPFWLVGNAAYQNLFWIGALGVLLARASGSARVAVVLLLGVMCGSPELLREFVTGGDLGTNAIYVLVFVLMLVSTVRRRGALLVVPGLAAVGLGLALSSRPNWVFLLPLVLAALARQAGARAAAAYGVAIVAVTALVTLPFYLYDPAGFSPLHVAAFIGHLDQYIPHCSLVIYGVTVLAVVVLTVDTARRGRPAAPTDRTGEVPSGGEDVRVASALQHLTLRCAAVQALPVLIAAVLLGVYEGFLTIRGDYAMARALQMLATGHIYVYALLYAWTLANRSDWRRA